MAFCNFWPFFFFFTLKPCQEDISETLRALIFGIQGQSVDYMINFGHIDLIP